MAPELVSGGNYGQPVDVWALGVTLYLLCSGRHPFVAKNVQELFKKVEHIILERRRKDK